MSDIPQGAPPIDENAALTSAAPTPAPSDDPGGPPPATVAAVEEASAETSPSAEAEASSEEAPSAEPSSSEPPAPDPEPAPPPVTEGALVDSPAAAVQVLGADAGIAPTEDVIRTPEQEEALRAPTEATPNVDEHPFYTVQRIRTKLAAYGQECLETVRPELEYLIRLTTE